MNIDITALIPILLGAYIIWHSFRYVRSRSWPTVEANIIEVEAQSKYEKDRDGSLHLNIDSDHLLEYSVDGKKYSHVLTDRANTRMGQFKMTRQTVNTGKLTIRYQASNPNNYVNPKSDTIANQAIGVIVGIVAIGFCISNL
ncbi:MAG: hypothetical protein ISR69_08520 [Gammaproteobacteria bacterium]|nr:hypothetical protein [Gammaproteobacteria bacterium]